MNANEIADKAFSTLRAEFALLGHTLTRGDAANGTAGFYAVRWGMSRYLPNLDAVKRFLEQIGGGHGV